MLKYLLLGLTLMCAFNIAAHADSTSVPTSGRKEGVGLGLGALIGGLIAGPPGAILGAAGGIFLGNSEARHDAGRSALEQRLEQKQDELDDLRRQFAERDAQAEMPLRPVRLEERWSAMEQLSNGITFTVYFRTASADPDPEFRPRLQHLARYLGEFQDIQLQIEAHADRRGSTAYNRSLSERRAAAVSEILRQAGIPARRIHAHAYGESQAMAAEGDREGYVFDRRVTIQLTLQPEA